MDENLHASAADLSRLYEPPRWRWLRHRHWKRHQQPEQIEVALWTALRGEYEPILRLGVLVP